MNVRHQLYKKYRIEGYSKYTAARKAGYSHNTAIHVKTNIENRLNMDYCLEKAGLTDTALAKHAEKGLKAERKIVFNEKLKNVADWGARHRYLDTILKLRGKLLNGHSIHVNIENHQHYTKIEVKDLENKSDRDITDIILGRANAGSIK